MDGNTKSFAEASSSVATLSRCIVSKIDTRIKFRLVIKSMIYPYLVVFDRQLTMNVTWMFLWLLSFLLFTADAKKRVCVIGAGLSGLFSVKILADHLDDFEPIAFERNSNVGGLWIYTDDTGQDKNGLPVHSSVYKYLRTNSPKEIMSFPDYQHFEGEKRSCVKHQTVVDYQKNYTDHFNLRQFIRFNTYVEKVIPLSENNDWRMNKWIVKTRNLNSNATDGTICDSIMVCTGQYYKPMIPIIVGMNKYEGRVLHSHSYRKPEEFSGQTVTVLGAAVSGQDIAFELSLYAKIVYLSHRHDKLQGEMPANVIQVPGIVAADASGLILTSGSRIESDSLIFCTGYVNELPFLNFSSGIEVHDKYLYPLYKQIVNINNPSMGFVGLVPTFRVSTPKFYSQANYFISLLQGQFKLPSREKMLIDAQNMLPKSIKKKKYEWHWEYIKGLANEAHFEMVPDFYRKGVTLWQEFQDNNLYHFKEYDLHFLVDGSMEIVKSNMN